MSVTGPTLFRYDESLMFPKISAKFDIENSAEFKSSPFSSELKILNVKYWTTAEHPELYCPALILSRVTITFPLALGKSLSVKISSLALLKSPLELFQGKSSSMTYEKTSPAGSFLGRVSSERVTA